MAIRGFHRGEEAGTSQPLAANHFGAFLYGGPLFALLI